MASQAASTADAEERLAHQLQRTAAAQAAERRRHDPDDGARGGDVDGASALMKDVRCPISLEVMRDPVIAGERTCRIRNTSRSTGCGHC